MAIITTPIRRRTGPGLRPNFWVKRLAALGDLLLPKGLYARALMIIILPIVLMSSFIGAIVGSLWIGLRGKDRATPIPFGPYLAAAGWVQLIWGPQLLQAYRDLSGLN